MAELATNDLWQTLTARTCPVCGILYAIPERFFAARDEGRTQPDAKGWWCPNGHNLSLRETELDRTKKALKRAEENAEWQQARRVKAEKAEKRQRLELKRVQVRVGNGVCPCCNRTFLNLQRHMNTKHPDYRESK